MAFKQSSFPYKFKLTEKFVAEVLEVDPEKYCKKWEKTLFIHKKYFKFERVKKM